MDKHYNIIENYYYDYTRRVCIHINNTLNSQLSYWNGQKRWVEENSSGKVLNLFAGQTLLDLDETRNDIDEQNAVADYHMDCVDFVQQWEGHQFDTIILDPPYALRKAMEMYNSGNWYWGGIAEHFKVDKSTLMRYIRGAEIYGYSLWTETPRED